MREKLITYVDLLFAGAPGSEEIHQEILQNTLDRYDDLIDEGKTPEAAYRLAISGIGDVNEIIGSQSRLAPEVPQGDSKVTKGQEDAPYKQILRAISIFLYIICPIPLLILSTLNDFTGMDFADFSTVGLCATLAIVALATVLRILGKKSGNRERKERTEEHNEEAQADPLKKSIQAVISALGLVAYFIISFSTGAWYITWLIFPLSGAISGLVMACMDLNGGKEHEK